MTPHSTGETPAAGLLRESTGELVDRLQDIRQAERAIVGELRKRVLKLIAQTMQIPIDTLSRFTRGPVWEPVKRRLTFAIDIEPLAASTTPPQAIDADYVSSVLAELPSVLFAIKECTPGTAIRVGIDPTKLEMAE